MKLNQNSIFTGTTAGLAAYGTAYYLTPASMGYVNFTISSFLANYISAVPAVLLGYALPALAAIGAGILLAAAYNTIFANKAENKEKCVEEIELDVNALNGGRSRSNSH
ncbi:MAG: hypothetical protein EBX41_09275 [Chitinophagia bacterium]|nr:hypothetical protein [Chitinophagia bacterium]